MHALKKIYSLLLVQERKNVIKLFFLMLVGMLLEALSIGLIIPVMALIMQADSAARYPLVQTIVNFLSNPTQSQLVIGAMLVLVCIYFIKNTFLAFFAWQQTKFTFGLQAQFSQRLFAIYLHQPYTFHLQRNSAQLIRNIQAEVNMLMSNALTPIMLLFAESIMLIGLFSLLLYVEPIGTLLVFAVLGLIIKQSQSATKQHISRWAQARLYHEGIRIKQLQQGLGGIKDVKLLGREDDFLSQYRMHTLKSTKTNQLQATLQQMPRLFLELLAVSSLAIVVISMVLRGQVVANVIPTLALFAAVAFRLMPSISRIIGSVQQLRFGLPVVDMLHQELTLSVPQSDKDNSSKIDFRLTRQLEVKNLTYCYAGSTMAALDNVSLSIKKGELVGFLGESGSGKSTLIDVILGLLPASNGEILVDGQPIQSNLRAWQNQIGYVPQSIYLTDDTIRRNVAFGLADDLIDDVAVTRAVLAAQLKDFIATLPNGINTIVGERGVRLSGGQRQRIGIARALYHNPEVLVLDEATSALDGETESSVMDAVVSLHGKKTILMIAHRVSTLESCDSLYKLENHQLVTQTR